MFNLNKFDGLALNITDNSVELSVKDIKVEWESEEDSHCLHPFPYAPNKAIVFINKDEPLLMKKFTLVHELGHHLIYQMGLVELTLWEEEVLAWKIGKALLRLAGIPIPKVFYSWAIYSLKSYASEMKELLMVHKELINM